MTIPDDKVWPKPKSEPDPHPAWHAPDDGILSDDELRAEDRAGHVAQPDPSTVWLTTEQAAEYLEVTSMKSALSKDLITRKRGNKLEWRLDSLEDYRRDKPGSKHPDHLTPNEKRVLRRLYAKGGEISDESGRAARHLEMGDTYRPALGELGQKGYVEIDKRGQRTSTYSVTMTEKGVAWLDKYGRDEEPEPERKKRRGRPPGTKNKPKSIPQDTPRVVRERPSHVPVDPLSEAAAVLLRQATEGLHLLHGLAAFNGTPEEFDARVRVEVARLVNVVAEW